MSAESERDRGLVRYLLGALSPAEQEELEDRYFSDPALHEELEAIADDLIHEYLSDSLSADDRQRFETYFLKSPRQRERLEFVQAVVGKVAPPQPAFARSPVVFWAAAAAVLAALALWLVVFRAGDSKPIQTAAGTPTPTPAIATPSEPPPVVRVARAATAADVAVSETAKTVSFEVAVDGLHASYDAVLRTLQGVELWRANDLEVERDGAPVRFSVPAAILAAGQYVLAVEAEGVRGKDPAAAPVVKCTLRVTRQP